MFRRMNRCWRREQALDARWEAPADTLVNNAGIAYNAPAEEMTVAEWSAC